jgi:hypothetical protein
VQGADLLIHDAQYTAQEYPEKMGWGHSPVEYVVKLADQALVKRVALTHHDPRRDDDSIERLMASVRRATSMDVFAACEGQVVELKGRPNRATSDLSGELAEIPPEQKLASPPRLVQGRKPGPIGRGLRGATSRGHPCPVVEQHRCGGGLDRARVPCARNNRT